MLGNFERAVEGKSESEKEREVEVEVEIKKAAFLRKAAFLQFYTTKKLNKISISFMWWWLVVIARIVSIYIRIGKVNAKKYELWPQSIDR